MRSTGELPLYQGLVRELLLKAKDARPELFDRGSIALARADEAAKLPRGHEDRARAFAELIAIQRVLMDAFP